VESLSFLDHLKFSGLLAEEQFVDVSGRLSNSAMEIVISDLVEEGLLTPFQVKQLQAGQAKGLVLGQYHLLEELGRGGYGCVYKARHKLMNRVVALKVIAPERVEDSRARAWFRREVLAATQLQHPNIALAYDADEIDGVLFFAMEFIDGLNLDALVQQRGPVPIGTACEMLLQTAKALQYAHERGMVHRDIKPANLLIPRDTIAEAAPEYSPHTLTAGARPVLIKVVDFGLARLQSSSSNNTLVLQNERGFVGTPAYVSPEQARNVHEVDIRSDLYSLGCTFYYALAGRAPFQASTPLQVVVQHLEKEPEPIERLRPEMPLALASIVRRLMAKKPEKRFQTPSELLGELGFFYNQDRSGIQRVIPFALPEPVPSCQTDPSVISPTAAPASSAGHVAKECDYAPTRMMMWENEPKTSADATEQVDSAEPSIALAATVLAPQDNGATATCVIPEAAAPASSQNEQTREVDRNLMRSWQQWAHVIDALASGRSPVLDDAAYRALHRQLLEACKTHAAQAGCPQAALFQRMVDLVQPWLNLRVLDAIDRETLVSLRTQSHAISASLGHDGDGSWKWAIIAFFLFLAGTAGFFTTQNLGNSPSMQISAWMGFFQRNPLVSLTVLVPAVLIASVVVMKRLLRVPRRD
jgi:eukaryotic-like serine/threonine-protein kinase